MRFHLLHIPVLDRPRADPRRLYRTLVEQALVAEAEGWTGFWVAEHHFGRYGGAVPMAGPLLAHLAARTSVLRLGAAVAVLPLRDPVATCEEFAMVDALSDGRLELGVGRGFMRSEFDALGVSMDARAERFATGLDAIERLLLDRDGTSGLTPAPTQAPVPLWVAVSTAIESCRLAGERGHGLMLNPYNRSAEEVDRAIDVYRLAYESEGHAAPPRVLVNLLASVPEADRSFAAGASALDRYLAAVHEQFVRDPAVAALPTARFDDLYPDRLLFGDAGEMQDTIAAWEVRGVTDVAVMTHFGAPASPSADATRRALAESVLPAFAGRATDRA